MRRFCFGMALILLAAAARAEDAPDQPTLVLQSGGHTAEIRQVLFTPDGKEVITASHDKTIRRWDAATGQRLGVLYLPAQPGEAGRLEAAALSPDGKTLAAAGNGYKAEGKAIHPVYLIDLAVGRVAAVLPDAPGNITALAFSHDGKLVAAGFASGSALIWDAAAHAVLHALEGVPKSWVHTVAFSPDDKHLACGAYDDTATIWTVETGAKSGGPVKTEEGKCLAWKDDDTLVTGGDSFQFWSASGKRLRKVAHGLPFAGLVTSMTLISDPDPKKDKEEVFFTWYDGRRPGGAVLNLAKPGPARLGLTWEGPVNSAGVVSPDGKLAATIGDREFGVNLWTVKDGKMVRRLAGKGRTSYGVGWGPDGWVVGWNNTPKEGPAESPLLRAFDLGELRFARKPDAKFHRAVHSLGDLSVGPAGGGLEVRSNKAPLAAIKPKDEVRFYSLTAGDRVLTQWGKPWNVALEMFDARTGKSIRRFQEYTHQSWELAPSSDGRYVLASCGDQALRIWDVENPAPLLSLFVAGSDWVAWTREGYYAASPGGEKLMGWQVNNGLDQLGTFYPAEQFHKAFYRPDVIQRVLAEGSVEKALAAADKESGKTTEALDVAKALPPDVKVLAPAEGKQDAAAVEVKAEAVSKDRPVVIMHLLLDGRPCPGADAVTFANAKPGDKQTAAWKVTLPDGDHHLAVLAETDASLGASPEVAVSYQPAAAPAEPLPTLYVLAVGINTYPGSLKLEWAVDDATAVQKAFQTGGAPKPYGKVETTLLADDKATKAGILAGLDWLKEKMTADDTAVVFYAGHGHRDKKTGQFYMLPQDVDVSDLAKTGVTGTTIKEKLKAVPGKVLVLLDACHSGSIGQSPADPGSLTDDVQRQLAAPDCGVVVMCGAMAQEEAGEAAAVKHGYFTAALLSGLGGGAPLGKDGLIHLTALDFYVEEQVAELSKDEQHVVIDRPSTLTSFPLVKPPAQSENK